MRLPALLLLLSLTACSTLEGGDGLNSPNALAHNFNVQRGLTYTPDKWPVELKADLYAPRGVGPHAAVLVAHGGGWDSGDRGDLRTFCEYLAQHGFVAVAVDYRLAPEHKFPAPLHDLQQAMRWLKTRAESLGVDEDRIGAFGFEAGGQLVALLATVADDSPLSAPHGGALSRPRAVVVGAAPMDLRTWAGGGDVEQFLGAAMEQAPELYALASPVTHASPSDPPFLLYHGTLDLEVPIAQSEAMREALVKVGVRAELLRLTGLTHILVSLFNTDALENTARFFDQQLRARAF